MTGLLLQSEYWRIANFAIFDKREQNKAPVMHNASTSSGNNTRSSGGSKPSSNGILGLVVVVVPIVVIAVRSRNSGCSRLSSNGGSSRPSSSGSSRRSNNSGSSSDSSRLVLFLFSKYDFSFSFQYSFPHHRHNAPHFRRQLSPIEQKEILTDIQQNHRYQQPLVDPRSPTNSHQHPFSIQPQQQYQSTLYNPQQEHLVRKQPTQQSGINQHSQFITKQSGLFPQPQSPLTTQQSAILLSLQQSPLSSPQFSSLFSQQPQAPISTQNSLVSSQHSPAQLSLENSPLSNLQSVGPSGQLQSPRATQQSPVPTKQSPTLLQSPFTTQQSSVIFSQQSNSPLSTQQSSLSTQESRETQVKPQLTTQEPNVEELTTDIKILKGISNTEFTIQRSISDPEELKKVQMLELQREKERIERLKKIQEEQLKLIQEENERRRKEREEEDRRDEERRLKLQETLRKIQEEKERRRKQQEEEELKAIQERRARLLKQQQEEQLRKLQDEERRKKEEEEKLRIIKEQKEKEEKEKQLLAQTTEANTKEIQENTERLNQRTSQVPQVSLLGEGGLKLQPAQSTVPTAQQPVQRPRQRARLIDEPHSINTPEELFLQDERQKLYYQLKEAQQIQEKQQSIEEKQQTQESQQIALNNRGPPNQITQTKGEQRRTQPSKLEKQLHQKQLQEQLQKQFQLQLLQRQDLLRQLKLAVANAATPTNEDQIVPAPVAISGGNNSAPLFLANGQKIQVVQSTRQGRPLTDIIPRNVPLPTSTVSTTTQRPPRALFEELTKGVLPPGADFELIRHKQDGGLEDVGKQIPQNLPQKKVTFVFLEEQSDGTFKVKGVRGNNNGEPVDEQAPATDVESIIKKIQEGDLKLPVQPKLPTAPQSTQQYTTSFSPATPTQPHIPPSTVNAFPTTVKPKNIIKTVSSSFNFQPQQTTTQPGGNFKAISSINFQPHPEMEFLPSVTLPPRYEVSSTLSSSSSTKQQPVKETVQTESPATYLNSPYSVEVHPGSQNSGAPSFTQDVSSSHSQINSASSNPYLKEGREAAISTESQQNIPEYQQKITPVTPYPTISEFSPTPNSITTIFPPNKYSPSQIQYTTQSPKTIPQEPFLPTDPSFVRTSQSYSPFFGSGSNQKQTSQKKDSPVPGIIYANPSEIPTLTTNSGYSEQEGTIVTDYRHKQRDFQQNVEAPSLKSPTRVAPPAPENILKDSERILPLDEDGSIEYQSKTQSSLSLADVLKKEGLYAMARFIRESGLNNILNDTGPYTVFAPTDKAFRALLVQLGGPEKAEEKFKENPRLLSGVSSILRSIVNLADIITTPKTNEKL
ncbi:hypothetical protein ANN_00885 [Periplaneta americana]|uniref:FAS1 domain-containing protein n=1 Tax=Periplaneta americana TaxID=6978 RepID=A0ABQ8TS07_PERAM|nr:hypothetical protein ANN_00885 [Periplaneta americana]